ncbi:hypothetical protein B0T26DRAFT_702845 [Lasiosphaeria miniovina]|uniref:Uncharacterized protein n=1 Tax=Lasiosphaeria miniovina TaxID=1954250 RepID=A0AA40E0H3_9PEZI|nr:uncharacterized protein B0T26DRAFT_702845 [Lasiosphaeria miniovina]KAK0722480.1 hypothetical protein B0T26DRAFT_702845 [Lasiosphaeria miniovina]
MQTMHLGDDDSGSSSDDELITPDNDTEEKILPKKQALQQLEQLKSKRNEMRNERGRLSKALKPLCKSTKELQKETKHLKFQSKRACVKSRDEYTRAAMRRQFVDGIHERDIETQALAEKDGIDFEVRDYHKMANSLRVFCVSSKTYQLMSGRLDKDDPISGFADFEDTEIPELRRHGLETTRTACVEAYQRFLRELSHILASVREGRYA